MPQADSFQTFCQQALYYAHSIAALPLQLLYEWDMKNLKVQVNGSLLIS